MPYGYVGGGPKIQSPPKKMEEFVPCVLNARGLTGPASQVGTYVGRPTKFGNPHPIGLCVKCKKVHDRAEAIEMFRVDLMSNPVLLASVKKELAKKNLICWCAPNPCHADILLEVANS